MTVALFPLFAFCLNKCKTGIWLFCVYSSDLVGATWLADLNLECFMCGQHRTTFVTADSGF